VITAKVTVPVIVTVNLALSVGKEMQVTPMTKYLAVQWAL
jgi:hypothetical protein